MNLTATATAERPECQKRVCELARREFIAKVRTLPLLRSRFVVVETAEGLQREPLCAGLLRKAGLGWGQVADLGTHQLIYLKRALPKAIRLAADTDAVA
jgi:hypothetical protein